MTERILLAVLVLAAIVAAGAFFLYVSILPIVIGAGAVFCAFCAGVLALGAGKLTRWIEIVEIPEAGRRERALHWHWRWLVWPWA